MYQLCDYNFLPIITYSYITWRINNTMTMDAAMTVQINCYNQLLHGTHFTKRD